MLQICEELFSLWNAEDLPYCHWKSNDHLDAALDGDTDLDIFVPILYREKALTLLSRIGLRRFLSQPNASFPNVEDWLGFDATSGKLIHVHLYFKIITGIRFVKQYELPVGEMIISRRQFDYEHHLYLNEPEFELILLFIRVALKSYSKYSIKISNKVGGKIDYLKKISRTERLKDTCKELFNDVDALAMMRILERDVLSKKDLRILYSISHHYFGACRRYSTLRTAYIWGVQQSHFLFTHFYNRLFSDKYLTRKRLNGAGITICLIGQDGAGKTTLIKDIEGWLSWKLSVNNYYLGRGDGRKSLLGRVISLVKKHHHHQETTEKSDEQHYKKKQNSNRFVSTILAIYTLFLSNGIRKSTKLMHNYARKGGIAISDRYPQTQFNGLCDGPRIPLIYKKWGQSLMFFEEAERRNIRYCERLFPNLVIKLVLPPEVSIKRKPNESYDQVKQKSEVVEKLRFPQSLLYVVDANHPYDEVLLEIKSIIWKEIAICQL